MAFDIRLRRRLDKDQIITTSVGFRGKDQFAPVAVFREYANPRTGEVGYAEVVWEWWPAWLRKRDLA